MDKNANFYETLGLGQEAVVSVMGGGGKTSLIKQLTMEYTGKSLLVTTTTAMYVPDFITPVQVVLEEVDFGVTMAYGSKITPGGKLLGVSLQDFPLLAKHWSLVLCETDGSKGRSIKAHASYEPVIPEEATHNIVVLGMDILGKPLEENYVHRADLAALLLGEPLGTIITREHIFDLLAKDYLLQSPKTPSMVYLNKVEEQGQEEEARLLGHDLKISYPSLRIFYGSLLKGYLKEVI